MGDLERIKSAPLSSVLQGTSELSRRRLNGEESQALTILIAQTLKRYPSQDLSDSVGEIAQDMEQLSLKYSLLKVRRAVEALRICPGQAFFPRADEIAEEIENQRERKLIPTIDDTARYLGQLAQWKKEHYEYMAELEEERRAKETAAAV